MRRAKIHTSYPDRSNHTPDSIDTKGCTGFYDSPDGLEKDVSDSADWYHTYNLEPNFYYFEFGD